MTDPQLPPPPGAVPPVPPVSAQPQPSSPGAMPPPAYPAYAVAPPAPPAAPPGAYQVPVGGYAAPSGGYVVPDASPQRSSLLGVLALGLSLVAAVVIPVIGGLNAFEIGRRLPQGVSTGRDLSFLSPAREQVLWTEISFWTGTVLGIAAIVLGILAIRRKQGRGAGIAALVIAVVAVAIFFVAVLIAFGVGGATGVATTFST